jgi:glycogen debranching enzyme
MLAWHRYLATLRDPGATGLLLIYHPWESGTDNSPRWDAALQGIEVGELPTYQRHDLKHVADASERPSQAEYDRYIWLVESLKREGYEDSRIWRNHPFQIRDVLMSAIFAAASRDLAHVAEALGRDRSEIAELTAYVERFSRAVQYAWNEPLGLALDYDDRADESVRVQTCAGLAPLLLPNLEPEFLRKLVARLEGPDFAGAAGFAFAVVPSTIPGSPGFRSRAYWRGPSWPVFNWLMWWALRHHGARESAARLRWSNLALLENPKSEFGEYFEPYTAEPLGSTEQSWTAAVALDWLTNDFE